MDFGALVDPSSTLGAFIISMAAGILIAFFSGYKLAVKIHNVHKKKNTAFMIGSRQNSYQDIQHEERDRS